MSTPDATTTPASQPTPGFATPSHTNSEQIASPSNPQEAAIIEMQPLAPNADVPPSHAAVHSVSLKKSRVAPFPPQQSAAPGLTSSKKQSAAPSGGLFGAFTSAIDRLPPMPPPLRIAVVGSNKAGKTQIISRFISGTYERRYIPTAKIDISVKVQSSPSGGYGYTVEVWDIPSLPKVEDMLRDTFLPQMDGAIIVTDSTDLKSFQHIRKWSDLFTETQITRLADNLTQLGAEDDLSAHSLPGADGKLQLVSTFPCILFANKSDSERCTLTRQDILESASHFKLNFGFLGSALMNKPYHFGMAPGAPLMPINGNFSPAIQSAASNLASLSPSDSIVDQAFHFLLNDLLKYQHLRSITPALSSVGPQGHSIMRTEMTSYLESSLHSHAQHGPNAGLASKRFLASAQGPAVPLPASLARLKTNIGGPATVRTQSSAFSFDMNKPPSASPIPGGTTKNALAKVMAQENRAEAEANEEEEEEDEEDDDDEDESSESEEDDDDDDDDEDDDDDDDDDDDEEEAEEAVVASPKKKKAISTPVPVPIPAPIESVPEMTEVIEGGPEEEEQKVEEPAAEEQPAAVEEQPAEEQPAEEQPVAAAEEMVEEAAPEAEAAPVSEEGAEAPAEEEAAVVAEEAASVAEEQPAAEEQPVEEQPAAAEEQPADEEEQPVAAESEAVAEEQVVQQEEQAPAEETPQEEVVAAEEAPVEAAAEEPAAAEEQPAEEEQQQQQQQQQEAQEEVAVSAEGEEAVAVVEEQPQEEQQPAAEEEQPAAEEHPAEAVEEQHEEAVPGHAEAAEAPHHHEPHHESHAAEEAPAE